MRAEGWPSGETVARVMAVGSFRPQERARVSQVSNRTRGSGADSSRGGRGLLYCAGGENLGRAAWKAAPVQGMALYYAQAKAYATADVTGKCCGGAPNPAGIGGANSPAGTDGAGSRRH